MLPFSTIGEKLDDIARFSVVYAVTAIFLIGDIIAFPDPFGWVMAIPFMTIAIFFWSIYRPTVIPAFLAFAIGLIVDVFSAAPLGLNAIIYVVLQWAISDQRAFLSAQSFLVVWLAFALVNAAVMLLQWFISGLFGLHWSALSILFASFAISLSIFPFLVVILRIASKILPSSGLSLTSRELQ